MSWTPQNMKTETFKNLDWLAVVFYPLTVILMEAFWVSPYLNWIGVWPLFNEARPVLSLVSVIIIIVVSLVITRTFNRQQWSLWKIQLVVIGSGLITMLLVLAVEYNDGYTFLSAGWFSHIGQLLGNTFDHASTVVAAIPAIIYLWWRGIGLGQSTSYFRDIYRSFLLGVVALVVLIIFWQISSVSGSIPKPGADIGVNVIVFFFFGLLAIAISHLYNMRRAMPKEEAGLTSVWRWLPVMLGVIGVMILIGFGVASLFSPEFIDTIGSGAQSVFGFLSKILEYIMWPIVYIATGLIYVFKWLLGLLAQDQPDQTATSANMTSPYDQKNGVTELSPLVTSIIRWTALAIIIAVVIFFLARAISRYRARHAQEDFDEVRESLFSWRGLRDDLKEFFSSFGRRRKPAKAPAYNFKEDAGQLDIREIYRHMQWEAGRSGIARRRHETAVEYAQRIEDIVPDSTRPLGNLTNMYENVRYGEEMASVDKETKANSLWQNLKVMIRKLRGA
jgi:large-conductance mechanosensitive channel